MRSSFRRVGPPRPTRGRAAQRRLGTAADAAAGALAQLLEKLKPTACHSARDAATPYPVTPCSQLAALPPCAPCERCASGEFCARHLPPRAHKCATHGSNRACDCLPSLLPPLLLLLLRSAHHARPPACACTR